ncbi:MAG: DNA-binding response regulator, partial [Nocardioides sp.]|nr:DNA-binding response regulator [Nocardioides sp.]
MNDYQITVAGVAAMLAPYEGRVDVVELDDQPPVRSDVDIVLFDTFAHVHRDGVDLSDILSEEADPKVVVFTWTFRPDLVASALAQGAA